MLQDPSQGGAPFPQVAVHVAKPPSIGKPQSGRLALFLPDRLPSGHCY